MIFFGRKASKIGELDISNSKCQHCENSGTQHISVFGKYFHVYWIPFFPIGKEAVAECVHCKRTISQKEFPVTLKDKYQNNKDQIKRPIWHWTGLGIIGAIIILFNIMDATREIDPRSELLKADIEQMSASPTMETDSTSFKLKAFFNDFANEEINPSEFEFITKSKDDKVLILAKIPNLKKVQKEGRKQVIEMIEMLANSEESLKNKDKYIGVHGKFTMMMLKTPTDYENSNIISDKALYEFYGQKSEKEE